MNLEERIISLREGIIELPSMSDMVEACQTGNKAEQERILGIDKEIKENFSLIFTDFQKDLKNVELLSKYADILLEIRPLNGDKDFAERVIFLLYVNNSHEGMNLSVVGDISFNFGQLICEYVNWDAFRKHFCDANISPEFFDTEGEDVGAYQGDRDKHIREVFLAMKEKFTFT